MVAAALAAPEDTFGLLRDALGRLELGLRNVRTDVERREALAAATPSIWPTVGWVSSWFGHRQDPFTGDGGQHSALDISTDKGSPVVATADGVVESAEWNGNYGNLLVIDHGFGIKTRYGHLAGFAAKAGSQGPPRRPGGLRRCDGPRHGPAPPLRNPRERAAHQPTLVPRHPPLVLRVSPTSPGSLTDRIPLP